MYTITLSRQEAGKILSALRERRRRFEKAIAKFGDDFDPELGAGWLEGLETHTDLIRKIQESGDDHDNPRRSGSDRQEP